MPRRRPIHDNRAPIGEGTIEREFGVPIPGQVVAKESWTQTALKKLPDSGQVDTEAIFGRLAPLVVDIGCGNGRFSLGSAWSRRDHDHLAADILPVVIRYATRRGNQRGLTNLRFCVVDGERLVTELLPAGRVKEIHCYHPQPNPKPGEGHGRLIQPFFMAEVIRVLEPGGLFVVQTDNIGYWAQIKPLVEQFLSFRVHPGRWPDSPRGRSRREIYAMKKGLPVHRGMGNPLPGLDYPQALELAAGLVRKSV